MEKRTSAAKAGYGSVNYGTAEAVPFQNRVSCRADLFSIVCGMTVFGGSNSATRAKAQELCIPCVPAGLKTRSPGLEVRGYTNGLARTKLLPTFA
jgi:hypothetical protein